MQLDLGQDKRTDVLRRLHAALIATYGRIIRPPDKRRSPEWVLVQGVIGAQTKTAASNASTDQLLADHDSWEAVAQVPVEVLTAQLWRQTFPSVAGQRLSECLGAIIEKRGAVDLSHLADMKLNDAMEWLEALPGIARKISAGVMNASTLNRKAIVIDGHHRRIMQRMGIVPPKADTTRAYDALMPILPPEWSAPDMDEHHLLLKKLGQTFCRPRKPDCAVCFARQDCKTGTEADLKR